MVAAIGEEKVLTMERSDRTVSLSTLLWFNLLFRLRLRLDRPIGHRCLARCKPLDKSAARLSDSSTMRRAQPRRLRRYFDRCLETQLRHSISTIRHLWVRDFGSWSSSSLSSKREKLGDWLRHPILHHMDSTVPHTCWSIGGTSQSFCPCLLSDDLWVGWLYGVSLDLSH